MSDKHAKALDSIRTQLTKLPPDALGTLLISLERHSYSARLDAHHLVRNILWDSKACSKIDLVVLSGRDKTDSSGKATLSLEPLLCGVHADAGYPLVIMRVPPFVATAASAQPVLVTAAARSTPVHIQSVGDFLADRDGNVAGMTYLDGVTVEVATWKLDGTPAPDTSFSWICTVETARRITFG